MFDVNESLLALLGEGVSHNFALRRRAGNVRQYRKEDIENIRLVYHLVKETRDDFTRGYAETEDE